MNKNIVRYLLLLFIIILTPILVLATSESDTKETEYEKPTIDEILGEEEFPEEKESSSSAHAKEKEWYEYVTYSTKPINEYTKYKTKYIYYDPYDYSYANIMEINDVIKANISGDLLSTSTKIYDSFSTANEKEISYSVSNSKTISDSDTTTITIDTEVQFGYDANHVNNKFGLTHGWSNETSQSTDTSVTITEKYSAVYFNSNGTPYSWKIVHYVVYIPLKVKIQTLISGEWVDTNDIIYIKVPTIQGTCRQYIKNQIVYYEHWGTGEAVTQDDFWDGFFTEKDLKKALSNKLLPN